ncbi:S-adenosyl-l-methionine hydroxide adenosyltransferase family protein [Planomonospora sp. ID82291]|uniref:SAM hydrolase/SAM-dependent halogenase family protein n=1 Tax=Planomonospora sp. ID82291 TaxID=2738136 RepID=UPI0018C4421F|nr:SAM-dependent chlorinase/fluorinase [Planomonospora sp. ID82291]MBG0814740.1 SAM-dependent chlorinase/fluorinase [Planomonospora sp. ID82291]
MTSVITLLTDYGLEDGYVAMCHGVIAGIAPGIRIIDVCHLVPSGDVRRGAAILAQTVPYLPAGVHVAVIDPGPGGSRRAVAVEAGDHVFLGPDNGVLSWAVHAAGGARAAHELVRPEFFLDRVSPTFQGRDVFAPVAAHLATGRAPAELGPAIPPDRLFAFPAPASLLREGAVEGEVLSVDRYGNVQLSISSGDLGSLGVRAGSVLAVRLGRRQIAVPFRETFAAVPPGDLVAFTDSAGLIALAVHSGDASQRLGLPPGAHVRLAPAP